MSDLPSPGDPLVVGVGGDKYEQITLPDDKIDVPSVEERYTFTRLRDFAPVKEITKDDLPETEHQEQMTTSLVIALKMLGLHETDIADVCGVTLPHIEKVIKRPAAQFTFERMVRNIIDANATSTQGRIASYANDAVTTVVTMMQDNKTRDDVRLKAAQDVLDRSGTNADQYFNSSMGQGSQEDELQIVFTDEGEEKEKVKVNWKKGK